jgi:transcriptional regulator with XRE-family HTH domain
MPAAFQPQLGRRIRERRTRLELTQEQLAGELGVTHQHISRIEGGDAVPSLELLVQLACQLGVSTDHLLTGEATVPVEIAGAIRSDDRLSAAAKRHVLGIIAELAELHFALPGG